MKILKNFNDEKNNSLSGGFPQKSRGITVYPVKRTDA